MKQREIIMSSSRYSMVQQEQPSNGMKTFNYYTFLTEITHFVNINIVIHSCVVYWFKESENNLDCNERNVEQKCASVVNMLYLLMYQSLPFLCWYLETKIICKHYYKQNYKLFYLNTLLSMNRAMKLLLLMK